MRGCPEIGFLSKKKTTLFWPKAPDLIQAPCTQGKTRLKAANFLVHIKYSFDISFASRIYWSKNGEDIKMKYSLSNDSHRIQITIQWFYIQKDWIAFSFLWIFHFGGELRALHKSWHLNMSSVTVALSEEGLAKSLLKCHAKDHERHITKVVVFKGFWAYCRHLEDTLILSVHQRYWRYFEDILWIF